MLNFNLKDAAEKVNIFANAVEFIHAVGNFCKDSANRKLRFQNIPINSELFEELVADDGTKTTSLRGATNRPLYSTRWVMRQTSLDSILSNYEKIVTFLNEIPEHSVDFKVRAKATSLLRVLTQPCFDNSTQLENVMTHWGSEDLRGSV